MEYEQGISAMIITQIQLENIKSYRRATVRLEAGTTAIRGHNGAGKSTLVEAIGFALFDWLPYSPATRFLREGEKSGQVAVTFVSADDGRAYEAVRRVGASATWFVMDPELRMRVVEGKEDVVAFLRRHTGFESALGLDDLFTSAVAVPQGTFTADFLQPASARKKKFDALLQIEDYRKASDGLLDTQRYLEQQINELAVTIERLTAQTADLDAWREERQHCDREISTTAGAITSALAEQAAVIEQRGAAQKQREAIAALRQEAERLRGEWQTAIARAQAARDEAERTAHARQLCAEVAPAHVRHLAVLQELVTVQEQIRQADALAQSIARDEEAERASRDRSTELATRSEAAARAARERDALAPLVARQNDLERRLSAAREAAHRMQALAKDRERLARDREAALAEQHAAADSIAATEPLAALADLLGERRARVRDLTAREASLRERAKRIADLSAQIKRVETQAQKAAREVEVATRRVVETRALEADALRLPAQQAVLGDLNTAIATLQASMERDEQARAASRGGMCPFLKEPCLNMRSRGIDLEEYFSQTFVKLLDEKTAKERDRASVVAEVDRLRALEAAYARLDDYLHDRAAAQARCDEIDAELKRLRDEMAALVAEHTGTEDLAAAIVEARRLEDESAQADHQCATLPALRDRRDAAAQRIAQMDERTADLTAQIAAVQAQAGEIASIETELAELGDPRARQHALAAQASEADDLERALAAEQAKLEAIGARLAQSRAALAPFADLEDRLKALAGERDATAQAHETFLRCEAEARRDDEAQLRATHLAGSAGTAEAAYLATQSALDRQAAAFDEARLSELDQRLQDLTARLGSLQEQIKYATERREQLTAALAEGEQRMVELRAAESSRAEHRATLEALVFGRATIKEAAPHVMRALLREISATANRIFGDIMGDRAASLAWQEDYDITLRVGANERHFAQLSGGEQMSAALAVRLAILRTLTNASLVVLDEPTQSMDAERRTNLAEQIRRVHDFEQMLVISHDDTFEEGLDAVVWVRKEGGESQAESEGAAADGAAPALLAQR
jgi:exonuclease SbcC